MKLPLKGICLKCTESTKRCQRSVTGKLVSYLIYQEMKFIKETFILICMI